MAVSGTPSSANLKMPRTTRRARGQRGALALVAALAQVGLAAVAVRQRAAQVLATLGLTALAGLDGRVLRALSS